MTRKSFHSKIKKVGWAEQSSRIKNGVYVAVSGPSPLKWSLSELGRVVDKISQEYLGIYFSM